MFVLSLGLALTAIFLVKVGYGSRLHAAELGSMSHQWVAAYQASQPASSI